MKLKSIIKRINIKNNDTDSYLTILFEIDLNNIDLNTIFNLKHKSILMELKEDI